MGFEGHRCVDRAQDHGLPQHLNHIQFEHGGRRRRPLYGPAASRTLGGGGGGELGPLGLVEHAVDLRAELEVVLALESERHASPQNRRSPRLSKPEVSRQKRRWSSTGRSPNNGGGLDQCDGMRRRRSPAALASLSRRVVAMMSGKRVAFGGQPQFGLRCPERG